MIEFNYTQSKLLDSSFKYLDSKSKGDFYEWLDKIELIKQLTNPYRPTAKDLPKDKHNKIIIDLEKPHILEDMDFFRERALYFLEHGCYTHLFLNPNPNSEYRKFWDEERRRFKEGLVRESDGEWIPGYYYFYLNYSPILKIDDIEDEEDVEDLIDKIQKEEEESIQSERVEGFPDVWDGDYWFFHYVDKGEKSGKHGTCLKTRGRGYSLKFGAMGARNFYSYPKSKTFVFASEKEFLIKDGTLNKTWDVLNFVDNNTPLSLPRDYKDTDMHKKASYRDPITKTERGTKSEIMGVTCNNDPEKGRGKRGKLLIYDESGVFPGLKQTWKVAQKSLEQGRYVFGYQISAGTGGSQGADFEAAEDLFYHPDKYNILKLNNIYSKVNGQGECGLFVPEYINRQGCYDKNGNSDVIKALLETSKARQIIRKASTDNNALLQECAESPVTPEEAVLRKEGSIFPVMDIKDYLADIRADENKFISKHYVGRLIYKGTEIAWTPDDTIRIIREYPLVDKSNKEGGWEIFEMPVDQFKTAGHYIAGIDPVDDDYSVWSDSLPSIIIFNRLTRRIVAEYTGRPKTAFEFYEQCYRGLRFYEAKANYENDKKGLYGYFFNKNCLNYLTTNTKILEEKGFTKAVKGGAYGNKKYGTNSSVEVNQWGRRLQADWLLQPAYSDEEIPNLRKIKGIAYLKELSSWNPTGNFDRISAMGMCLIYDQDLGRVEERTLEAETTYSSDPFFARNEKKMI